MNHGHVNKYYVLGDSHRLHCIFTCKTQSWPCIFLKHFVKTAKVFLALKAHTNKTCCTLEAHSAILFFWLQSSHLSKDELVGPTGRKILLLRKEVSHLRKPEGHMFTEWKKKKNQASLVKISESGALLHSISLFTVIFSCNGHSTRLKRCSCKIIVILPCCLSHTYFFCQT